MQLQPLLSTLIERIKLTLKISSFNRFPFLVCTLFIQLFTKQNVILRELLHETVMLPTQMRNISWLFSHLLWYLKNSTRTGYNSLDKEG